MSRFHNFRRSLALHPLLCMCRTSDDGEYIGWRPCPTSLCERRSHVLTHHLNRWVKSKMLREPLSLPQYDDVYPEDSFLDDEYVPETGEDEDAWRDEPYTNEWREVAEAAKDQFLGEPLAWHDGWTLWAGPKALEIGGAR